jgi:4-methyl-5(b-hydroxyethyl)-thiazole monophosphate biosynthesis
MIMTRVLVPLAQGCEELEAVTIIDLLRRAEIEVVAAGLDDGPVTASRGVRILPDMSLDKALELDYDMVALPGGLPGSDHLAADERLTSLFVPLPKSWHVPESSMASGRLLIQGCCKRNNMLI